MIIGRTQATQVRTSHDFAPFRPIPTNLSCERPSVNSRAPLLWATLANGATRVPRFEYEPPASPPWTDP